MRYCLILVLLLANLSFSACDSSGQSVPQGEATQSRVIELRPVPASILSKANLKLEVVQTTRIGGDEINQAQFVDVDNGWAGNRKVLYRTSNAGKTWERLKHQLNSEAYISSFFFVNKMHGWLTVIDQKQHDRYGRGYSSTIFVTHDGGNTWNQQSLFSEEVHLHNIAFVDEGKGMAVGARLIEQAPERVEIFVVGTSDGGRTWTDISEQVKVGTKHPGAEYRARIGWVSSSRVYILTQGGRVMASETGGDTWKMIADFEDIRPTGFVSSTGFYKLLFSPQGRLAVLAGAAGEEGYWGDIIVPNDRNSWTSYELMRVPLFDAAFLSDDMLLACGQELYVKEDEKRAPRSPRGVILYSNDLGKTWSYLHHTSSNEALRSLTRINSNEFYAISDIGNFMKFKLMTGDGD
jgi:photosystem II stability/assembly factor-like uncharacterized protein